MTLPNHIQPLPHQQGHGALIAAPGSSLGRYACFSSLGPGATRFSAAGQTYSPVRLYCCFLFSLRVYEVVQTKQMILVSLLGCAHVCRAAYVSVTCGVVICWIVLPPKVALVKYR